MSIRSILLLMLLCCTGFIGNYWKIPMFFGADFLFGSIAVMLVLYFYGFGWGMFAALVAHSYTWYLWGHPFGFINFTSEAFFVGFFLKRGRRNLLVLDTVFWLLLGMPLAWLYHGVWMHMDAVTATFIMLKQAINGIFCVMLASAAINILPISKIFQPGKTPYNISLQRILFNIFAMMVLLPALFFTMLEVRHSKEKLESEVAADLLSTSANLQFHLHYWFQQQLHAVMDLAEYAYPDSTAPSSQLQRNTEFLHKAFPYFLDLHVEDEAGRTIAFSPSVNQKGMPTIGQDLSDRAWFQEAREKQGPVVSDIFRGRLATFAPIVVVAAPILRDNQWHGTAAGALDLEQLQGMLKLYCRNNSINITLTDSQNKIIGSSIPNTTPMQVRDWRKSGIIESLGDRMYFRQPSDSRLPSMTRWKLSFCIIETPLGPDLPWMLILESSVAPLQRTLYKVYVNNLAVMVVLIVLFLFISHLISHWLTNPLNKLSQVTVNLPARILEHQNIDWPGSTNLEIGTLIDNAKVMTATLEENIRELRKQKDEIEESEAKYHVLFESSADGIFLMTNIFLDCNTRACKLWQCERSDIIGHSPLDFSPPFQPDGRSSEEAALNYLNAAFSGEPQYFYWLHRRKDGVLISCEISLNAISIKGEKLLQAAVRDITRRKMDEEEKEKLKNQLNQSQRLESVGRLAGGVAHDFNNMLGIISGYSEMGKMHTDPSDPIYLNFTEISRASERAADLVRQLLAFARKQTINPKVINLNDAVSSLFKMLKRLIRESIDLTWLPGRDIPPVKMDSSQLDQILANLLVNAKDAIDGEGKITIETGDVLFDEAYCAVHEGFLPGQYVLLAVSDNGSGIEKELFGKIFEPFFSTKEMGRGTGLGLATVYGIVKQNNGFINVYSEPGQGTTFKIYLPVFEGERDAEAKIIEDEELPKGTETILLTEDEEALLNIARDILKAQGYTVLATRKPTEALSFSKNHPGEIHLLVTDVVMPEMNGRMLFERLENERPGIKCLFMSGYTANVIAHHGVLDKGVHFIEKPFSPKDLAFKIRKTLDT